MLGLSASAASSCSPSASALGAKGAHQRAADLAAVSAAQVMRDALPAAVRAAVPRAGVPNPRHLGEPSTARSPVRPRSGARAERHAAARRATSRFPGDDFAPTRVSVRVRGEVRVAAGEPADAIGRVPVAAEADGRARARRPAPAAFARDASGGGYDGPLAYRQGKPMRPDVALAFDRMAAAARREAGLIAQRHERLSLRRRAGAAVRRAPRPEVGRAARREPAPATPPSSTSARPPAYAWLARERAAVRLRQAVRLGAVALRLHAQRRELVGRLRGARRRRPRDPRRPVVRPGAATRR